MVSRQLVIGFAVGITSMAFFTVIAFGLLVYFDRRRFAKYVNTTVNLKFNLTKIQESLTHLQYLYFTLINIFFTKEHGWLIRGLTVMH